MTDKQRSDESAKLTKMYNSYVKFKYIYLMILLFERHDIRK